MSAFNDLLRRAHGPHPQATQITQASAAAAVPVRQQLQPAAPSSPPADDTPRPSSAAPADLPPAAVPYRKGAGCYVPPGTANGPIVAGEGEWEGVPTRTPRPAKKTLPPVTLQDLVKEWRIDQAKATHRALRLGDLAQRWIVRQPERPANEQLDRASALKVIRRALLAAGIEKRSCRVDRHVRCWQVARLLGGDAETLSISSIREMQPLVQRDKVTEAWQVVPEYCQAANQLWIRMLAEKLSAETVRGEVLKILPPRTIAIRKKPIRPASVLKLIFRLSPDDQVALMRRWEEGRKKRPAAA